MKKNTTIAVLVGLALMLLRPPVLSAQEALKDDTSFGQSWTHVIAVSDVLGGPCTVAYNSVVGAFKVDVISHYGGDYGSRVGSNGFTLASKGPWLQGFTHLAPFAGNPGFISGDATYYIAYNSANGVVQFNQVNSNCKGSITVWSGNLGTGWTHLMPFSMDGALYFMTYNSATGARHFNKINAGAKGSTSAGSITFVPISLGTGWSHLMPFSIAGRPYFMVYNSATGAVQFNRINANATTNLVWSSFWGKGWTYFAPAPSTLEFIAYNAATGLVHFDTINATANGITIRMTQQWTKGVSSIAPFYFLVWQDLGAHSTVSGFVPYTAASGDAQVWRF